MVPRRTWKSLLQCQIPGSLSQEGADAYLPSVFSAVEGNSGTRHRWLERGDPLPSPALAIPSTYGRADGTQTVQMEALERLLWDYLAIHEKS